MKIENSYIKNKTTDPVKNKRKLRKIITSTKKYLTTPGGMWRKTL